MRVQNDVTVFIQTNTGGGVCDRKYIATPTVYIFLTVTEKNVSQRDLFAVSTTFYHQASKSEKALTTAIDRNSPFSAL